MGLYKKIRFTGIRSTLKTMYLSVWKRPNKPSSLNPSRDELNRSAVNDANIQQKKVIQPSFMLQKDDTSSMANRRPPTGAPNAAATPAAAPAVVKLRLKQQQQHHHQQRGQYTRSSDVAVAFRRRRSFGCVLAYRRSKSSIGFDDRGRCCCYERFIWKSYNSFWWTVVRHKYGQEAPAK